MAEENTQGQGQPRQRARTTMPPKPSAAWKSFTRFRDDDGNYKARCKRCQKVFAADARKNGTVTLWKHADQCKGRETAWGVVVKQIKLITTLVAYTCTGIAVRFTPADQIEEQQKRCAAYSQKALPFAITTFLAYVGAPSASSTKTTFKVAMAAFFLAVPADLVCMTRPPKWGSLLTYLSWFLLVLVSYLLLISFNEGYSYAILPVPIPVVIALLQLNRSSRALNRDIETGHLNADTEDETVPAVNTNNEADRDQSTDDEAVPAVNNTANNQEADQDLDGIFNSSAGIVNKKPDQHSEVQDWWEVKRHFGTCLRKQEERKAALLIAFGCQAAASISDDEVRWTRFARTMLGMMVVVVFSAMVVLGSVAEKKAIASAKDMEAEEDQSAQVQGQPGRRPRRVARRRSGVYEHFTRYSDGDGNDRARCRRCQLVLGASTRNGTSTLWTHVRICWGEEAAAAARRAPRPPVPGASPSRSRGSRGRRETDSASSADLARMIALHGYDPSFVEDGYFRSFVRRLNPEFEAPSRAAIEEMCDGIFDEARRELESRLRRAPGRVSLAVGKAKTPEAGEVIYIACHFIDDQWNLHKVVLDAFMDDAEHHIKDGPILGVCVFDGLVDVKLVISEHEDRLSMVAYDITDGDFHPELKNYIDQDINSDASKLSCTTATYVDAVLHSIARCLTWELKELNLTRQERLQLLSELDLDLEWAFDESWCATYCSLRKRGFTDQLCEVELLCKVWEQVYSGIQRISASTSPTSNLCLAELLKPREILHSELARVSGDDAELQERNDVLRRASNILDEAIQDSYLIWSVPLALDPRYKLRYIRFRFEKAFGSEAAKFVSEVTTKINNMYADYIKEYGADQSDSANPMSDTSSADPWDQEWNDHCRSEDVMAAAQSNSRNPETQTELDRYLQEDPLAPATKDFDVLKWWKAHSSEYPMVARMARDALAMPTCSKLSSDQLAQVRSILRGYSKKPYGDTTFSSSSSSEGGDMIR
ncbi:zinc finger BED domain-containing protein RICESLEEPER 1-like [Panicum miliaceum]|uniref:Zinc finger BED domain-containing protein RICESLEEPER 1-like n=1 Tax=Panicum miliaceum TaxID=4540 RepID=A0A3L6PN38_PANMI|nr:zinc finger BED domain-containing protein RICESLEEPER 1-like [Panicum miliaceum]